MTDEEQIAWNERRHSAEDIRRIERAVGVEETGVWDAELQHAVESWQLSKGLVVDGLVGSKTLAAMEADHSVDTTAKWVWLTDDAIDYVMALTIEVESAGRRNPYAAANRNAEYEGWFDKPKRDDGRLLHPSERAQRSNHRPHPASKYGPHPSMIGLSHGPIQTTLDSGSLGKVIQRWHLAAPEDVDNCFRGRGKALVELTTRAGPSGFSQHILRGPRVQPLDGHDLWEPYWMPCWNAAAEKESYKRAQRSVMRSEYFNSAIDICKEFLHSSQAHLAIAFDCCVQYGGGGARSRFKQAGNYASIPDILDVIGERSDQRARLRRAEIAAHCDVFTHYEDLVFAGPENE